MSSRKARGHAAEFFTGPITDTFLLFSTQQLGTGNDRGVHPLPMDPSKGCRDHCRTGSAEMTLQRAFDSVLDHYS